MASSNPTVIFCRNAFGFLAGFGVIFLASAGYNAAGDPFADYFFLAGGRLPRVRTIDQFTDLRFKTRLVRQAGRDGLDAAVFGSSRVMRIDPANGGFATVAPRALNLGVQGARLGITTQFVDFVMRRNPRCRPVIALDFFAFNVTGSGFSIYLDEKNPLPAWRDSLTRLGSRATWPETRKVLQGVPASNKLLASGLAIRERPDAKRVHELLTRFAESGWRDWPHFRGFQYDPGKIATLRALRERYPRTIFYVSPVSRWYLEGQALAGLDAVHARWLADLAEVGPVLDFSGATDITGNERLYYDPHHYDTEAGALILSDVAAFVRGEPLRFARVLGSATPVE